MFKLILLSKEGKKFFVKDINADYHCQFGFVTAADLKKAKPGVEVKTNKGESLVVLKPTFIDLYQKIKRGPQIIAAKDIGSIIAETGINKTSIAVDAGGGSGALCFFLANICKKITTYEIREDFTKLLEENKKFLSAKNITIKNKNIYEGIDEKNIDLITLDLPEPWLALKHAEKALVPGGFLISYSPSIPQVSDFVAALKGTPFIHLKTKEVLERKWEIEERKIRPFTQMLGHTGFLTICRKM